MKGYCYCCSCPFAKSNSKLSTPPPAPNAFLPRNKGGKRRGTFAIHDDVKDVNIRESSESHSRNLLDARRSRSNPVFRRPRSASAIRSISVAVICRLKKKWPNCRRRKEPSLDCSFMRKLEGGGLRIGAGKGEPVTRRGEGRDNGLGPASSAGEIVPRVSEEKSNPLLQPMMKRNRQHDLITRTPLNTQPFAKTRALNTELSTKKAPQLLNK